MKIRRYKKVSKHVNFFVNNFNFRQPFQILIDGTFCYAALNNKINIEDNIPKYLQTELKFLTTPCVVIESESLGRKVSGALLILKKFPIHKCGHEKNPIPGADCLLSMIGKNNSNHYMIATQDYDLQAKLRHVPGVPLLYLHQKTPVLEQPSPTSLQFAKRKTCLGEAEMEAIQELRQKHGISDIQEKPKKRKRKGGPNPLSCKKKKKKVNDTMNNNIKKKESTNEIEKKKRKKIRIPKHVKEELLKETEKF